MRRFRRIAFALFVAVYAIVFWYLMFAPTAAQLWARFGP